MKNNIKSFVVASVCVMTAACSPNAPRASFEVIPRPQSVEVKDTISGFILDKNVSITYLDSTLSKKAAFLSDYIKQSTGIETTTVNGAPHDNSIILRTSLPSDNAEAYALTVYPDSIVINGASEAGLFYGIQTLRKSLPTTMGRVMIPIVEIKDAPRFPYRGVHLDVSRHFFGIDSIKQFIDILALHNINRFHWHLTDDQGWRLEIKKYPELTAIASQRNETVIGRNSEKYDGKPYGGYYTQDEAREIVRYAADRGIVVVPEIDLPGHMQAALKAYPELGCTQGPYEVWTKWGVSEDVLCIGEEKTLPFITDVLDEVIDIFPSEYIHIGGDECPKVRWKECPKCQAKIRELGITADAEHSAEDKLQSYVITYAEKHLNEKGRKIIGWDEILEGGLAPNATVMSWRGIEGGIKAAQQGNDVIMTPNSYLYFDYYQSRDTENEPLAIGGYVPIEKVYSFEPVPTELTGEQKKHIIGVQANMWTEYMPTFRQVEYMLLPRVAALSEVQWCEPKNKEYKNFLSRLPQLVSLYRLNGYNYADHVFDVNMSCATDTVKGVVTVTMFTIDGSPICYTLDGSEPTETSPFYTTPLAIDKDCIVKARVVRPDMGGRIVSENITVNKATAKKITMLQPINKQYEFNGAITLVDGLTGDSNYKTGRWIAFYKNDFEAVIDLGAATEISQVSLNTCVAKGDWVLDIRSFRVEVSDDGQSFKEVASVEYPPMAEDYKDGVHKHTLDFDSVKCRYVKLKATPEYSMPDWHPGKGHEAFIFIDEVSIK